MPSLGFSGTRGGNESEDENGNKRFRQNSCGSKECYKMRTYHFHDEDQEQIDHRTRDSGYYAGCALNKQILLLIENNLDSQLVQYYTN